MYEIIKKITSYNQSEKWFNATGGIQHSTGNEKDTSLGNANWFNTGNRGGNAHYFTDNLNIVQTVETNQVAYHARNPANGNKWGCEMCQTLDANEFNEIWKRQVWLWGYLFTEVANPKITNITIETLRSHDEENQINHIGDRDNHTDPTGYFALFGKTMQDMRDAVQKYIDTGVIDDLVIDNTKRSMTNMVIKKGSKGQEVVDLQNKLNRLGYDCGYADGDFGQIGTNALIQLQSNSGLVADGICGAMTMSVIDAMIAELDKPVVVEPVIETPIIPQENELTSEDEGLQYLYTNGYLKSKHEPTELLTLSTFGYIMKNKGW